jgi:hypothetical protein
LEREGSWASHYQPHISIWDISISSIW